MRMRDLKRAESRGSVAVWILGVVLAVVAVFVIGYLTLVWLRGPGQEIQRQERRNERVTNEESQQYVETQLRSIREAINRYEENAVMLAGVERDPTQVSVAAAISTQQAALVRFVKAQALTITAGAIPTDVRQFIASH